MKRFVLEPHLRCFALPYLCFVSDLPRRRFLHGFVVACNTQTSAEQSGRGVSNAAKTEAETFHVGESNRKSFRIGLV